MMRSLFQVVTDLPSQADLVRRRGHGLIEVVDERFVRLRLRPFPKRVSLPEIAILGKRFHHRKPGNRCLVFYNQTRRFPNYLALKFVISTRRTTLGTLRGALQILDEIARIKGSDAILCDVANPRISDRLLSRWGWQAHKPSRWHRHFIKRFYGQYPDPPPAE